jgi:predicted AAA+ superfamily ATPase
MISRLFKYPKNNSFFLFGPRGAGKSSFIRTTFEKGVYINLLEDQTFQFLLARNEYQDWNYKINYWHTKNHIEVDFVLYGERGLQAIEVKSGARLRDSDFDGLLAFQEDYPKAKLFLLYGGTDSKIFKNVQIIPVEDFLRHADKWV